MASLYVFVLFVRQECRVFYNSAFHIRFTLSNIRLRESYPKEYHHSIPSSREEEMEDSKSGEMNKKQGPKSLPSPKGGGGGSGGQCLCSPTSHQGSFRCRFHRSLSSAWMMRRSKSFADKSKPTTQITTKPLETA